MFQDCELWDWIKNKMANTVWESVFLYLYIQFNKKKMEVLVLISGAVAVVNASK